MKGKKLPHKRIGLKTEKIFAEISFILRKEGNVTVNGYLADQNGIRLDEDIAGTKNANSEAEKDIVAEVLAKDLEKKLLKKRGLKKASPSVGSGDSVFKNAYLYLTEDQKKRLIPESWNAPRTISQGLSYFESFLDLLDNKYSEFDDFDDPMTVKQIMTDLRAKSEKRLREKTEKDDPNVESRFNIHLAHLDFQYAALMDISPAPPMIHACMRGDLMPHAPPCNKNAPADVCIIRERKAGSKITISFPASIIACQKQKINLFWRNAFMSKIEEYDKEVLTASSNYISVILDKYAMNGDVFIQEDKLFEICRIEKPELTHDVFLRDFREQLALGFLKQDGHHIYLQNLWICEEAASKKLAALQMNNDYRDPYLNPVSETAGSLVLSPEQLAAVDMALNYRISMILGGAGSGKSTLIRSILARYPSFDYVLCAPTGKAARNLSDRTGCRARTVHSACGLRPDDDFQPAVQWRRTGLVIVDEASMLSLELLAHLLCRMPENCHLVLIGDPDQLQSVGAGNVIPDLLALGFPAYFLTENYRQAGSTGALRSNVVNFHTLRSFNSLSWDDGFSFRRIEDERLVQSVVEEAAAHYLNHDSFQVLTPYNKSTPFSVRNMNPLIRDAVNPLREDMLVISDGRRVFRDGDRVMLTKNDREKDCNIVEAVNMEI